MAITKEQKAALQAAGYTVKGNTVMSKSGGSVGGYNENGKIWSGSGKVRDILKSSPAPTTKAAPQTKKAAASRPQTKKEAPVAKDAMKGYRAGDVTTSKIGKGGRGDGAAEKIRRMADRAIDKADKKAKPSSPAKPRTAGSAESGAGVPILAAAARKAAKASRAKGSPSNPSYTGKTVMKEGFQGKYETGVSRGRGRAGGESSSRLINRLGGGRLSRVNTRGNLLE